MSAASSKSNPTLNFLAINVGPVFYAPDDLLKGSLRLFASTGTATQYIYALVGNHCLYLFNILHPVLAESAL